MSDKPLHKRVREVVERCMYTPDEAGEEQIRAEGIKVDCVVHTLFFHPGRLAAAKDDIAALIAEMDPVFNKLPAGGASFLQLCMDKHGQQWGEHLDCEGIVALAIGTEQGGFCLPRDLWGSLPGGMPYVWLGEGAPVPAEAA